MRASVLFRRGDRFAAGGLLAFLALRYAWALAHGGLHARALPSMAAAIMLGGCLWWVAQRQVGGEAAALALGLYVSTPAVLHASVAEPAALGLFAMLYTAVGVAHALAGPRRKWPGRIGLMAAVCALTGWTQPAACAAGLVLALGSMLFLMEERRRLLLPLFLFWAAVASSAVLMARIWPPFRLFGPGPAPVTRTLSYAGLLVASAGAFALWARHRRSRYFGHSAPLLATFLLAGLFPVFSSIGPAALVWALPFALLFVAGALDDGLKSRRAGGWRMVSWAAVALQALVSFWY